MFRYFFGLLIVGLLGVVPATVQAIPRFAVRTGQRCSQCHVNQQGGGPRNRYGRNVFEKQYLSVDWKKEMNVGADTELGFGNDDFSAAVGADLRAAYLWTDPQNETPTNQGQNTFFLMQADLYVTAELTDYVTASLDKGQTRTEAYGMVHSPDRRYWLKAGQFLMPYGLRFANHKVFVRQSTGFDPSGDYRGLDTGVEAGAAIGPFNIVAAVANGKAPGQTAQFDGNDEKGFYGKVEYIMGGDGLKLRTGLSGMTNFAGQRLFDRSGEETSLIEDTRIKNQQAGLYLGAALGRIAYIGEVDYVRQETFETDSETLEGSVTEQQGYVSYQELSFLPIQGLSLQGLFEFRDPDTDIENGSITRVGGGFELYPLPMLEWKLLYRHTFADQLEGDGEEEIYTYLHLYF